MKLYIKQKVFSLTDQYHVFNEYEEPIFAVKGEFFSLGAKIRLYDMQDNELFFIKQKLMVFLPTYEIYKDNSLYAQIKKEFTLFSKNFNITCLDRDLSLQGNLLGMDFEIQENRSVLGTIQKKWLSWGDTYEMNIENETDMSFFCTLVIAIDHCIHNGQKK